MRTLIFFLLASLTSTLALAGVKIEHWTAPSGAKVYFVETRVLPILDVQIDFPAGGVYVPAAKAGLAGLTQGLLEAGVWSTSARDWAEAPTAIAPASVCALLPQPWSATPRSG
jgi:zinc protease